MPKTNLLFSTEKFTGKKYLHPIILATCWTLVQVVLLYQYGIATDLEAAKYIHEADNILSTGNVSTPNFWLYSTQIFLIALAKILGWGYFPVVLVQWFFNTWATKALYSFASKVSTPTTGLVIGLLFIFNIPIQTFNSILQTESLFYSLTIIFTCHLLQLEHLTWKKFAGVFLFLILITFTRPTGLLWIPCAFLFLFFRFFRGFGTWLKIAITAAVTIIFLFLLNAALGSGGELDFMLPFRDERIICGVPTLDHFRDIQTADNPNSLYGLFYYITHNFGQFVRLAALRTQAFFGLARDYYSTGHNIYLAILFYPLFILAAWGIRSWIRMNKHVLLYCLSLILITWLTVIMTCDDWHNRFFLSVVPYFYILSIPAIRWITDKLRTDARQ